MIEQKMSGLNINLKDCKATIDFSTEDGIKLLACLIIGMKVEGRETQSEFIREVVLNREQILQLQKVMEESSKEKETVH